jgi:hypothetical protein
MLYAKIICCFVGSGPLISPVCIRGLYTDETDFSELGFIRFEMKTQLNDVGADLVLYQRPLNG